MKKIILIGIMGLFLLTGCNNETPTNNVKEVAANEESTKEEVLIKPKEEDKILDTSFQILDIKSGMSKKEIEDLGYKIDAEYNTFENTYFDYGNAKYKKINPNIQYDKIYFDFTDEGKLYRAQVYFEKEESSIVEAAKLVILKEKFPNIDINSYKESNFFTLFDDNLFTNSVEREKKKLLEEYPQW